MNKKLLVVCLCALAGCGTTTTTTTTTAKTILKNVAGETRYCYRANDGTLGSMGAMSEYTKCLNDAGAAGFIQENL